MDFEALLSEKYSFQIKPQQRDAVLHDGGPVILTGVPGSGKTVALALRCAELMLCRGVSPKRMLVITYDKLTRDDFEAAFGAIFGAELLRGLLVCTPVELGGLIMKEYAAFTNAEPLRVMEGGKRRLLRSIYAGRNAGEYLADARLETLVDAIGIAKHSRAGGETRDATGHFDRILSDYDAYMAENNCADHDEIQVRALAALEGTPALLERFRKRFAYIHADEAQELTRLQFDLIKTLTGPAGNLFITGDADQCLALGRAAWPEQKDEICRAWPKAVKYHMERNYRSTHAIADAVTRLLRQNFTRQRGAMNTGNEIGQPLEETLLDDYSLLAAHLASRLGDAQGSSAVIYRLDATAAAVADALDRAGIPFRLRGPKPSFQEHWIVQDILAFLALGQNPADIAALKRIHRRCGAYIGKEALAQAETLLEQGAVTDALDALLLNTDINGGIAARLKKLKLNLAALLGMPPNLAVRHVMEKLEYGSYLKKACGEGMVPGNLMQVAACLELIASYTGDYTALLRRVGDLQQIMDRGGNADEPAVTLLSAHAAKGAEFTNVYITDLHEGCFPAIAASPENGEDKENRMEEERNLLYTAVTRASKYVELIHGRKIGDIRVEPSRFIREMLPTAAPRKARPANKAKADGAPQQSAEKKPITRRSGESKQRAAAAHAAFPLESGVAVNHQAFGPGVVSAYDAQRDIVTIQFESCGEKMLAAKYSMTSGVIREAADAAAAPGPA